MANMIYGIDADADFTAVDVRDALVNCFKEAHCDILEETFESSTLSTEEAENLKRMDVEMLIQDFFKKTNGNFEEPTKESLLAVMVKLKEFAAQFRVEDTVSKHYAEMMTLVNGLK